MEIETFKKVLSKALDNVVLIGIKKGYFAENKKDELNDKLNNIIENGSSRIATPEEEEQYIFQIKEALENGDISLNLIERQLLESYTDKIGHRRGFW